LFALARARIALVARRGKAAFRLAARTIDL
jgi:hypothetical protein